VDRKALELEEEGWSPQQSSLSGIRIQEELKVKVDCTGYRPLT
jgi:hypothetical protein